MVLDCKVSAVQIRDDADGYPSYGVFDLSLITDGAKGALRDALQKDSDILILHGEERKRYMAIAATTESRLLEE